MGQPGARVATSDDPPGHVCLYRAPERRSHRRSSNVFLTLRTTRRTGAKAPVSPACYHAILSYVLLAHRHGTFFGRTPRSERRRRSSHREEASTTGFHRKTKSPMDCLCVDFVRSHYGRESMAKLGLLGQLECGFRQGTVCGGYAGAGEGALFCYC